MARHTTERAEARRRRVVELRATFNELLPEYRTARGTDNIGIAKALNDRGIRNLAGKEWSKQDVSNFTARDLVDRGAVPQPESTSVREDEIQQEQDYLSMVDLPDTTPSEPIEGNAATDHIPVTDLERAALPDEVVQLLVAAYNSGSLPALLEWWHKTGGEQPMPEKRPRLRGPEQRVNTGLLIDKTLKDRAFNRAKGENLSLSQLIEHLLWEYLGKPEEFVVSDE